MTTIQVRRGTAAQFAAANPVLASGEPALETDTRVEKIGDGSTAYNSLSARASGSGSVSDATTGAKGIVQLAGDLAGTAAAPTVPALAGKASTAHASTHASAGSDPVTISESQVTGLVSDLGTLASGIASKADASATSSALAGKASTSTTITAGTGLTGGGDLSASRTLAVAYGTASGTAAQGNDSRITGAVAASTTITAGTGLTGGGDLTTNRTLSVAYGTTSTTATAGNDSRVVNAVQSTTITAIVKLTQAAYDALGSPSSTTLYVVVG